MNKSGLIDAVSKTTSLAKREAEEAVNALVHVVSKEVRSGRRVVVAEPVPAGSVFTALIMVEPIIPAACHLEND